MHLSSSERRGLPWTLLLKSFAHPLNDKITEIANRWVVAKGS